MADESDLEKAERLVREATESIVRQRERLTWLEPGSAAARLARRRVAATEDRLAVHLEDLSLRLDRQDASGRREGDGPGADPT